MTKYLAIALVTFLLAGCYSSNDARKALEAQGFTDIEITGRAWFACSKSDTYATSFKATNPQGRRVSGAACSGLFFKNTTVRW